MIKKSELVKRLKRKKLSISALCRALGITNQCMYNYLNNKTDITAKTLLKICDILECEIKDIYSIRKGD